MIPDKSKFSITTHVILLIVFTITLVLIAVASVVYDRYSRIKWEELETRLALSVNEISTGVALAVWNFDDKQIHKIMESAMHDPVVSKIEIESDNISYIKGRDNRWNIITLNKTILNDENIIHATKNIEVNDEIIGTVKLYFTRKFVEKNLENTLHTFILIIIALDFLLVVMLYLILWYVVLHPLKLIEQYALSIHKGNKSEVLKITQPLVGEFNHLNNALVKMVELLDTHLHQLTQSNERFWSMVSGFPIALGIYSPTTGEIIYLNKRFTQLFGYDHDELADVQSWFEKAYPDDTYRETVLADWAEDVEYAKKHDNVLTAKTYNVRCKDGDEKIIEIGGVLSDAYIMAVFIDITDRKYAEDALYVYQEHLEDLVEQRTTELVDARDKAESANRSKSVFLANMSHELRTPLSAVIGFSSVMADEPGLQSKHKRNLNIIHRSGKHLLTLINDILELSKIEAGKNELAQELVDLPRLLHEIVEMLEPRANQAGISLLLETVNIPQHAEVDAAKLRQILLNLLANAVKFTQRGGVTLVVKANNVGSYYAVEFEVTDTGIGIAEEDQQRVFEPFEQVGETGNNTGTGLGLAISRQYVEMMGGELSVSSILGKGTTFRFSLTLAVPHEYVEVMNTPVEQVHGLSEEFRDYPIMVVDDVVEIRELMVDVLRPLGFRVYEAADGVEALEQYYLHQPKLIFVDWRMPKLDGIGLIRKIRELGETQPVMIMLTANAYSENRQDAIDAGADDFLAKPIDVQDMYRMMEQHASIRFVREISSSFQLQSNESILSKADLDLLSDNVREGFVEALRELNPASINEMIDKIRLESAELAERIEQYTREAQYRKLWDIFEILNT